MIDEAAARAVARWTALSAELVGDAEDARSCVRCGSGQHVMPREDEHLCARCYLECGDSVRAVAH